MRTWLCAMTLTCLATSVCSAMTMELPLGGENIEKTDDVATNGTGGKQVEYRISFWQWVHDGGEGTWIREDYFDVIASGPPEAASGWWSGTFNPDNDGWSVDNTSAQGAQSEHVATVEGPGEDTGRSGIIVLP